jgi:hypothetical protein
MRLKWIADNCSAEDWQYAMDMPALYILVRPAGKYYQVLLEEKSHSSKAGYASSTQSRLALSFKTKVHGMYGSDRTKISGHPLNDIDQYDKWVSNGTRQGFIDQAEESSKSLESSMSKRMLVHLAHKGNAHRVFLTLVTYSVQQILKLHRMMGRQFVCHRTVLGAGYDEGNWILSCQFAEAVFAGTWRARRLVKLGMLDARCIFRQLYRRT